MKLAFLVVDKRRGSGVGEGWVSLSLLLFLCGGCGRRSRVGGVVLDMSLDERVGMVMGFRPHVVEQVLYWVVEQEGESGDHEEAC
jgi:hypothetical protein